MGISVVWIRNDFRFHDNTALIHAVNDLNGDDRLMFVFHFDQKLFKMGSNSHDYFFASLNYFYKICLKKGIDIFYMYGELLSCFDELLGLFENIKKIYFNADESGYGERRDQEVSDFLRKRSVQVLTYQDHYINSAEAVLKEDGTPYKVFTPYYNSWMETFKCQELDVDYDKLRKSIWNDFRGRDSAGKAKFYELTGNIRKYCSECIGEENARERLADFVKHRLAEYDINRDYPYLDGTSHLSEIISTGQISIREVYNYAMKMPFSKGRTVFVKELAWRDFYNMIYHFYPDQQNVEINSKYRKIAWRYDEESIMKWKEGHTGFPIVDAAMRQLAEEGWIHNRLRMIAASFLVKDLLIDWRIGEKIFSEMLIDYDPASNIGGWQWASSVGTDAVPYFRIFNPTTQSRKFDPEGEYIRKYVRELEAIPKEYIHEPYKYRKQISDKCGIDIEKNYDKPVVDHRIQRLRALEMFDIQ